MFPYGRRRPNNLTPLQDFNPHDQNSAVRGRSQATADKRWVSVVERHPSVVLT